MKKHLIALALSLSGVVAMAQNAAVTNAYMYQKDGELEKARVEIDKAITNEATMEKPKTWYYRGTIYEGLMTNSKFKGKAPKDAAKIAYESYKKVVSFGKKGNEFYEQADNRVKSMWGAMINSGIANFNAKNYDAAIENYVLAKEMKPTDTTAYLYTAFAAEGKEDYKLAKENYVKLLDMGHETRPIYHALIEITKAVDKNDDETMKYVMLARKKYPNDKAFMLEELSIDLRRGKGNEAIGKLEKAIELDPKNANLYAVLGSLQDQSGNTEQAIANYKKAIELEPNNAEVQFNMGKYYFNRAADLTNKLNSMDYATYQKQGKKLEDDAKKLFADAIPYFEKALQINPNDLEAMGTLKTSYMKVGRDKEAGEMNKRITDTKAKKK